MKFRPFTLLACCLIAVIACIALQPAPSPPPLDSQLVEVQFNSSDIAEIDQLIDDIQRTTADINDNIQLAHDQIDSVTSDSPATDITLGTWNPNAIDHGEINYHFTPADRSVQHANKYYGFNFLTLGSTAKSTVWFNSPR